MVVVVWLMQTGLCMAAACVCQDLTYAAAAVLTCDSRETDFGLKSLLHCCHKLGLHQSSGGVT